MKAENQDLKKYENKEISKSELLDQRRVFTPYTDIYEKGDSIIIKSDIPGVKKQDIDISFEDSVLTLVAPQYEDDSIKDYKLLSRSYHSGVYRRAFEVGVRVNRDQIKADLKDGVLTIELPKAEDAKPKKIAIA